jgi:hypothetical protein
MKIGPVNFGSLNAWQYAWIMRESVPMVYLLRNRKGVIPGRWGFVFLGFEFGSRNSDSKFGQWLHKVGLWPFMSK